VAVDTTQALARQDEQRAITQADPEQLAGAMLHVLATGDLSKLTNEQRKAYYLQRCASLGLNSLSRPFDWLILDGKLVLYENKSCAEQLRRQHQISIRVTRREVVGADTKEPMYVVEVEGRRPNGQTDEASKYVPLTGVNRQGQKYTLSGRELSSAYAKAETGAKRRLTFSMVGMAAPPDPDELQRARYVVVDGSGSVIDNPTPEQKALAADPSLARMLKEPTYEDADASDSPIVSTASQAVRPEELERPQQDRPRATFKVSEETIDAFRAAWFAAVKGLSLDSDDARHALVAQWTADEWPKAKRTDSLTTMRARMTTAEADDFLAHVRALCEDERRELLEASSKEEESEQVEAF
jgi:hypothetical protein